MAFEDKHYPSAISLYIHQRCQSFFKFQLCFFSFMWKTKVVWLSRHIGYTVNKKKENVVRIVTTYNSHVVLLHPFAPFRGRRKNKQSLGSWLFSCFLLIFAHICQINYELQLLSRRRDRSRYRVSPLFL